jgi:hypothetical protein
MKSYEQRAGEDEQSGDVDKIAEHATFPVGVR